MNAEQLLTTPASQLTRKQRKDRAELKRQMATMAGLRPGHFFGQVVATEPLHTGRVSAPPDEGQRVLIRLGSLPVGD